MKASSPKRLSEGIEAVLHELGMGKKIKQYGVIDLWASIVGEQIAKVAVAEHVSGGKLFVRVARATWRNELIFLKKDLIRKINGALNEEIITDIIFR